MIKSELIHNISKQQLHLTYKDVESAVNIILKYMINELSKGGQVEIRNFGRFSVRKAIIGRNPRNGQSVLIKERHVVHFNTAKELKVRVNELSKEYPIKKV
jgi:integration host factor subunit beta